MSKGAQIRTLLCEDQTLMREGLRIVLDREPGLTVVGEAGDGAEVNRSSRLKVAMKLLMECGRRGTLGASPTGVVIASGGASGRSSATGDGDDRIDLSQREVDVRRLLGQGASNRDSAEQLVLAERTVKHHVSTVEVKPRAAGRTVGGDPCTRARFELAA